MFNRSLYGFRAGRSCVSHLLQRYQNIIKALESGVGVYVIYLDFAMALDELDHGTFFKKLH